MALKDSELLAEGVGIAHFFGGGVYVKETQIPANAILSQHSHSHDHLSYLTRGAVILDVDGDLRTVRAPACLTIEAGKTHTVHALVDSTWLCIWATDCTDPETVDDVIGGAA